MSTLGGCNGGGGGTPLVWRIQEGALSQQRSSAGARQLMGRGVEKGLGAWDPGRESQARGQHMQGDDGVGTENAVTAGVP